MSAKWTVADGASYYVITNSSSRIRDVTFAKNNVMVDSKNEVYVTGYGPQGQKGNTVVCIRPRRGNSMLRIFPGFYND